MHFTSFYFINPLTVILGSVTFFIAFHLLPDLIYTLYLDSLTDEYNNNTTNARKVIDYISGMTDEFFLNEYKKIKEA